MPSFRGFILCADGYIFWNSAILFGLGVFQWEINEATFWGTQAIVLLLLYIGGLCVKDTEIKHLAGTHFQIQNPLHFALSVVELVT